MSKANQLAFEFAKSARVQDLNETLKVIRADIRLPMSWGMHNLSNFDNKVLRFNVNGHHHKGHVLIRVNGSDLYDVMLASTHGNVKKVINDLYFDQLAEIIDREIEYIKEYN